MLLEESDELVGRLYKCLLVWRTCKLIEITCAVEEIDRRIKEIRDEKEAAHSVHAVC